ncbi:MarR family winged helix-turn-helix transcriptional regulator [Methanobacterium aggregans]|uniref:MarR family winged helix-turn-helix transcriptional regulator n=1 Tax=Methanobacterium aggregans TaxID=1615586 RepID=UPI001AE71313|nr:MarR family transcriptional regulator [Methanobacterium aggregans]MBP2045721.1 DNA-binding MarR family transcriptional regulator [Methanobacterium aggregans]
MDEKVDEAIEYWNKLNKSLHLKHHEAAKRYDLSLEQFHLLLELEELELNVQGDVSQKVPSVGEIAVRKGCAPHTISERLSRLQKKGLVDRVKDPHDLRISRIILTKKGKGIIKHIRHESRDIFLKNLFESMDKGSLEELVEGLKELMKKLE